MFGDSVAPKNILIPAPFVCGRLHRQTHGTKMNWIEVKTAALEVWCLVLISFLKRQMGLLKQPLEKKTY